MVLDGFGFWAFSFSLCFLEKKNQARRPTPGALDGHDQFRRKNERMRFGSLSNVVFKGENDDKAGDLEIADSSPLQYSMSWAFISTHFELVCEQHVSMLLVDCHRKNLLCSCYCTSESVITSIFGWRQLQLSHQGEIWKILRCCSCYFYWTLLKKESKHKRALEDPFSENLRTRPMHLTICFKQNSRLPHGVPPWTAITKWMFPEMGYP